MPKYGLISEVDARCLEKTIEKICGDFNNLVLYVTEVGVYSGETGNGIKECFESFGNECFLTGIDNNRDKEPMRFVYNQLIKGNSNEVYNQLGNESQHMVIIDANHSYPYVISDYYCYRNKIKKGGYLIFHDVAPHAQGKGWQMVGDEKDKDMSISVLKALYDLDLICDIDGEVSEGNFNETGFMLSVYDYDKRNEFGGVAIFKKIY